jgi:hypothetical protein
MIMPLGKIAIAVSGKSVTLFTTQTFVKNRVLLWKFVILPSQ